jgi:hypothetical protein
MSAMPGIPKTYESLLNRDISPLATATAKARINHLPHHLLVPGRAGGPVGRAGIEAMRRNGLSAFLVCLMFKLGEDDSVSKGRKGWGKKVCLRCKAGTGS